MKHTFLKICIIVLFLLLIILAFTYWNESTSNKFKLNKDNAGIYKGINTWNGFKDSTIVNTNCKIMKLRFLNNPFKIDSSYNMTLTLDTDGLVFLLYRGEFNEYLEVCIPDTILSMTYTSPKLSLFKDDTSYLLIYKSYIKIHSNDKYLYIAFFPEQYSERSCIMFSQERPLN